MKNLVKSGAFFLFIFSMIVSQNLMMNSRIATANGISNPVVKPNALEQLTGSGSGEVPGEFTSSGPYGGRTRGLAIDPTDSNTVFVAVEMAGLFRTQNGGENWEHVFYSGATPTGFVEIKPDDPTIIFFGGEDGLYRSDQGGDVGSWYKVLIPDPQDIQPNALVITSSAPDNLFCAINASVYFSNDAGQTWQERGNGLPDEEPRYLSVDPTNEALVYAGYFYGDLYKSENYGVNWQKTAEFPEIDGIGGITVLKTDPHLPNSIWIGTLQDGLYRSTDSGATFVKVTSLDNVIDMGNPRNVSQFGFWSISLDPVDQRIFIGVAGPGSAIFYTDYDEGDEASWTWTGLGLNNAGGADIIIAPDNNNILYTSWAGVRISTDRGLSWEYQSNGIAGLQFWQIAISPHNPDRAMAMAASDGAFGTFDSGDTWDSIYVVDPAFNRSHHFSSAFDPIEATTAYLDGDGVYKTINDGLDWYETGELEIPEQYDYWFARPYSLALHPLNHETIFAGVHFTREDNIEINDGGLYISSDGGLSWTLEIETDYPIWRVVIAPSNPNIIYLGTGHDSHLCTGDGIWRSEDGGNSWVHKPSTALSNWNIRALAVHPEDPKLILIGVWPGSNDGDGIYRSIDGGDSWEKTSDFYTHEELKVPDIIFDPLNPNFAYAATHGGLRVSYDTGLTWQAYPGDMGQVPITSLAATVDGEQTRLYIGTVGGKVDENRSVGVFNQDNKVISAGVYVGLSNLKPMHEYYLPLILH